MTECTHHWTVTSPCPFCQTAEIERLRGLLREWQDTFDGYTPVIHDRSHFAAIVGKTDAALSTIADKNPAACLERTTADQPTAVVNYRHDLGVTRATLRRLADAADAVGVKHFDTDDMSREACEMQDATIVARALLKRAPVATTDPTDLLEPIRCKACGGEWPEYLTDDKPHGCTTEPQSDANAIE